MVKNVVDNKVQCHLIPQGVMNQLYRSIGGKKPGLVTKVGLQTYVDPRVEGAKANSITKGDISEVLTINGEEWLNYKNFPINVALIRGTYADSKGNISFEEETGKLEGLPLATAAHNTTIGIVIAQVKRIVEDGTINAKDVYVPGMLVDYVVVVEDEKYHSQTMGTLYNQLLFLHKYVYQHITQRVFL